jgi:hypothetical protein
MGADQHNMRWCPRCKVAGTWYGLAASYRCEVTGHCAGASGGRVCQRRPHRRWAPPRCSRAANGEPAHGTPSVLSINIGPGGPAVADDASGIVHVRARRRREQHRARHPRARLLEAPPGRARQQQVPAGRGLAHLPTDIHGPGRPVQLSRDGPGELQPMQPRPAARRRQGLPAQRATTPASSR